MGYYDPPDYDDPPDEDDGYEDWFYDEWMDQLDATLEAHHSTVSDLDDWHCLNAMPDDPSDPANHYWPDDSWFEGFIRL